MTSMIEVEPELVWIGVSSLAMLGKRGDNDAVLVAQSIASEYPKLSEPAILSAAHRALVFRDMLDHHVVFDWLVEKRLCLPIGLKSAANTHPSCINLISKMELNESDTGTTVATRFIREMSAVLDDIPEEELSPVSFDDDMFSDPDARIPHVSGDFHDFVRARVGESMETLIDNLDIQCDSCVRGFHCESSEAFGIEAGRLMAYGAISGVAPAINTRSFFDGILKGLVEFRDEHTCSDPGCQDRIVEVEKMVAEMMAIMQSTSKRRRVTQAN